MSHSPLPEPKFIPLAFERLTTHEQLRRLEEFHARMQRRRTVREFSAEPVPFEIIERHRERTCSPGASS